MRNQASATTFVGSFPGDLPVLGLPEIALAGRSNVGKSSALNTLLGARKAARVSSRPGRTQAINLFQVGRALVVADLPGYGFARVPDAVAAGWKPMVERYLSTRDTLRMVVLFVDARLQAQELDLALLEGLGAFGTPVQVVATKLDKLSKHQRKPALAALGEGLGLPSPPLGFSSLTREGRDGLWDVLEAAAKR